MKYGRGVVGCDIGTQTIAYTSDQECGLRNLAERGEAITGSERKERLLLRKLDRSRRAMNPDNFNDDGTVKKGSRKWTFSKNYMEDRKKLSGFQRKNSINRHLAIREDVNHIRSLGDVFVTEPRNARKLMIRSKETSVNEKTGKADRKKRFGKSIRNRCPGYFQSQAEMKFTLTGGRYIEVPYGYRASLYSSFLLYNASFDDTGELIIDGMSCTNSFTSINRMHEEEIERIRLSGKKVLNSGIRVQEGET